MYVGMYVCERLHTYMVEDSIIPNTFLMCWMKYFLKDLLILNILVDRFYLHTTKIWKEWAYENTL